MFQDLYVPFLRPMDPLIAKQPEWRRKPHLYCNMREAKNYVGSYRTFLGRISRVSPIDIDGGDLSYRCKFDYSSISAETRALVVEGRFVQFIAKIYNDFLLIVDLTVVKSCAEESLHFRNRVASLLNEVSRSFSYFYFPLE